jgi:NADPH2:quinone reductase
MTQNDITEGLQLRSTVKSDGTLELALKRTPVPEPKDNEVVVRVEAAPINPSDLGLLFGMADVTTAKQSTGGEGPIVTATVPKAFMGAQKARLDKAMPCGNEGAGVVIKTGGSDAAQALMGKTVALLGGSMYAQYRCANVAECLPLGDDVTPQEAASCFVNPLTALGMVETMRLESHKALVHTAAASNLGQMLNKICMADGVNLINVVRKPEQVALLKDLGAKYVCNSSDPDFMDRLTDALAETGATIAFDATGGGRLASDILSCMEAAANRTATDFSRYGSSTHKQVYIYGGLERSQTTLSRNFGMAWGIGGWLLPYFLERVGPEVAQRLRERVAAEIKTTFASSYAKEVSLAEAVSLDAISVYGLQATQSKYLVRPNKDIA